MSKKLHELFPTADSLLEMTPETLAPILLKIGAGQRQHNGMFWPQGVLEMTVGTGMVAETQHAYPYHKQAKVDALVGETWELLRRTGMILPAPDINGRNGFMVMSRAGEEAISGEESFARIQALRSFPRELLHPAIADKAYGALQRGDYSTAVREAFTTLEVYTRDAAGLTIDDLGTDLMRKAFNEKTGPLRDPSLPTAEREAYAHMFAGAIGAFKNPHSHRMVTIDDPREAQRQLLHATHLLYVVDSAKARLPK